MFNVYLFIQIRLVALYQRTGRILEGYNLCSELEAKHQWPSSREWYSCLVEMAENYQVTVTINNLDNCNHIFPGSIQEQM